MVGLEPASRRNCDAKAYERNCGGDLDHRGRCIRGRFAAQVVFAE